MRKQNNPTETAEVNPPQIKPWIWVLLATAIYLICVMPLAVGDLWYDEVLTLTDFALDGRQQGLWQSVWRNYPMANNHILNSTFYWLWIRVLNYSLLPEQTLRLPSLLFGLGTIWLCLLHWRRWLGNKCAFLGSLLFSFSPVFLSYAYQIRGYSLTMFLSALCISGALEYYSGHQKRGHLLGCLAGVLLPLVMPSNLILALLAAVLYEAPFGSIKKKLGAALPILGAFALGGAYYLTIWPQFIATTHEPAGWDSKWLVLGNVFLAFIVHTLVLLPFILPSIGSRLKQLWRQQHPVTNGCLALWVPALLLGPFILTGLTLLCAHQGHAPYPRVFLVFLPQFTFGLLLLFSQKEYTQRGYLLIGVFILLNGLLWDRIPGEITQYQLKQGISPSHLLQQYYRKSTELSQSIQWIQQKPEYQNAIIFTDLYDYPAIKLYTLLHGKEKGNVYTFNRIPQAALASTLEPGQPLLFIAKNPADAQRMTQHTGTSSNIKLLHKMDIRSIYVLIP